MRICKSTASKKLTDFVTVEHYRKGPTIEKPIERENINLPNLPDNFTWVKVKPNSSTHQLLDIALRGWNRHPSLPVVFTGYGPSIPKTITCSEIMKRKCKPVSQTSILSQQRRGSESRQDRSSFYRLTNSILKPRKEYIILRYEITKFLVLKVEDHWEPLMEGLDPLCVVKEIPVLHVLLVRRTWEKLHYTKSAFTK
nr:EOG090X0KMN [Triops cancriformis]